MTASQAKQQVKYVIKEARRQVQAVERTLGRNESQVLKSCLHTMGYGHAFDGDDVRISLTSKYPTSADQGSILDLRLGKSN